MKRLFAAVLFVLIASICVAEQAKEFEGWKVHYSVVNSTFLTPEVAQRYDIVRADNRALCVISVLNPDDEPSTVKLKGHFKNLMQQKIKLNFKEVKDSGAIYYVATFHFSSGEELSFEVELDLPQGERVLAFTQKIYASS